MATGVGVASLQLAKVIGAKTIGVSGSEAKLEKLRELGLDVGIRARGEDFSAYCWSFTDGKVLEVFI